MHKARAFFFVCAGVFLLALAYHLGAQSAGAQPGTSASGLAVANLGCGSTEVFVFTPNGDLFPRFYSCGQLTTPAQFVGDYWSGSPTPAQGISIGQLKAKYAPAPGKVMR